LKRKIDAVKLAGFVLLVIVTAPVLILLDCLSEGIIWGVGKVRTAILGKQSLLR